MLIPFSCPHPACPSRRIHCSGGLKRPWVAASVEVDDVSLRVQHWQLLAALSIADETAMAERRRHFRKCCRPSDGPVEAPRSWWAYAQRAALVEAKEAPGLRISWSGLQVRLAHPINAVVDVPFGCRGVLGLSNGVRMDTCPQERRRVRLAYVEAYSAMLGASKPTPGQLATLEALDHSLAFGDIVRYRSLSRAASKQAEKAKSFFALKPTPLTEEELQALQGRLEEDHTAAGKSDPKEHVSAWLALSVSKISVTLAVASSTPLLLLTTRGFDSSATVRPNGPGIDLTARVRSVLLEDLDTPYASLRPVLRLEGGKETTDAFMLGFSVRPVYTTDALTLSAELRALRVMVNPRFALAVARFFQVPPSHWAAARAFQERAAAARLDYLGVGTSAAAALRQLTSSLSHHPVSISLKIHAPQVVLLEPPPLLVEAHSRTRTDTRLWSRRNKASASAARRDGKAIERSRFSPSATSSPPADLLQASSGASADHPRGTSSPCAPPVALRMLVIRPGTMSLQTDSLATVTTATEGSRFPWPWTWCSSSRNVEDGEPLEEQGATVELKNTCVALLGPTDPSSDWLMESSMRADSASRPIPNVAKSRDGSAYILDPFRTELKVTLRLVHGEANLPRLKLAAAVGAIKMALREDELPALSGLLLDVGASLSPLSEPPPTNGARSGWVHFREVLEYRYHKGETRPLGLCWATLSTGVLSYVTQSGVRDRVRLGECASPFLQTSMSFDLVVDKTSLPAGTTARRLSATLDSASLANQWVSACAGMQSTRWRHQRQLSESALTAKMAGSSVDATFRARASEAARLQLQLSVTLQEIAISIAPAGGEGHGQHDSRFETPPRQGGGRVAARSMEGWLVTERTRVLSDSSDMPGPSVPGQRQRMPSAGAESGGFSGVSVRVLQLNFETFVRNHDVRLRLRLGALSAEMELAAVAQSPRVPRASTRTPGGRRSSTARGPQRGTVQLLFAGSRELLQPLDPQVRIAAPSARPFSLAARVSPPVVAHAPISLARFRAHTLRAGGAAVRFLSKRMLPSGRRAGQRWLAAPRASPRFPDRVVQP